MSESPSAMERRLASDAPLNEGEVRLGKAWARPAEMGWDTLNLISTLGAYLLATGILIFIIDVIRHHRSGEPVVHNPWNAGTLDWLAPLPFQPWTFFSVPRVHGRYPLWEQAELHHEVDRAPTSWPMPRPSSVRPWSPTWSRHGRCKSCAFPAPLGCRSLQR